MGDWQVGDLALCIHGGEWTPGGPGPRVPDQCSAAISMLFPRPGTTWTVDLVEMRSGQEFDPRCSSEMITYLGLQGQPQPYLFDSRHFTKIEPHEPDAEDAETIYQLVYAPAPVFTALPSARMEAGVTTLALHPQRGAGGFVFHNQASEDAGRDCADRFASPAPVFPFVHAATDSREVQ